MRTCGIETKRSAATAAMVVALAAFFVMLAGSPASAQSEQTRTIAGEVLQSGFYAESGSGVSAEQFDEILRDIGADGRRWGLVALADEPDGGATVMAEEVLGLIRGSGSETSTVVVLAVETVGADSREFGGDVIDDALFRVIGEFEEDPPAGFSALYDDLVAGAADAEGSDADSADGEGTTDATAGDADGTSDDNSSDGGSNLFAILVAAALVAVLGAVLFAALGGRKKKTVEVIEEEQVPVGSTSD